VVCADAVHVPGLFATQGEFRAKFSGPVKELSNLNALNFPCDAVDDSIKIVLGHGISEGKVVGCHSSTRTDIECSGPPTFGSLIPEEDKAIILLSIANSKSLKAVYGASFGGPKRKAYTGAAAAIASSFH
jgi:hypothetical protein